MAQSSAGPSRRVAFADHSQIIPSSARSPASSPLDSGASSSYFTAKLLPLRPRLFGALGSSSSSIGSGSGGGGGGASLPSSSTPPAGAGAGERGSRTLDATLSPRAGAASAFGNSASSRHARSASASSVPTSSFSNNSGSGSGAGASVGSPPSSSRGKHAPSAHRAISSSQLREPTRPAVGRRASLSLALPWRKGRRSSGAAEAGALRRESGKQFGEEEARHASSSAVVQQPQQPQQQRQRTSTSDSLDLPGSDVGVGVGVDVAAAPVQSAHERRLASTSSSSGSSALGIFLPPPPAPAPAAAAAHAGASASHPHAHAGASDLATSHAAPAPAPAAAVAQHAAIAAPAPTLALEEEGESLDLASSSTLAEAEEEADFAELLASSSPSGGIFLDDADTDVPTPSLSPLLIPTPMPMAATMLRTGSAAVRPTAVRKPLALGREEESLDGPPSSPPILSTTQAPAAAPLPQPQAPPPPPQMPQQQAAAVEKTLRFPPMRPGHGEEVVSGDCICSDCDALLLLGLADDYHAQWSRGARRKYLADRAQRRMLARQGLSAAQQLAGEDVPHSAGASIASASLDSPAARVEPLPRSSSAGGGAQTTVRSEGEDGAVQVAQLEAQKCERETRDDQLETEASPRPAAVGLLDAARLKTDEASSQAPLPARRVSALVSSPQSQALLLRELALERTSSSSSDDSGTELDAELLAEIQAEAASRPLPPSLPSSASNSPAFGIKRLPSPGAGAQRMGARAMLRQLEAAEREEEKASACRIQQEEEVRRMGAVAEGLCRPWTPPVRIGSPEAVRRSASPLHLSIPSSTSSPPPRVPSPHSLLSGLRAPSPLHSRTPSPLGLSVPEGIPQPSRTPSPRLIMPSSPPLRAASPHQAFHALIAAPDVPHLLAISERDAPDEEEEEVLPPLSAIQRRPSPRPMLHSNSIVATQRLQSPPPLLPPAPTMPLRPASPPAPVISAATRAAADRLPAQVQPQPRRPSMQSRHSSSSTISGSTRRSSSAHGPAALPTSASTGSSGGLFAPAAAFGGGSAVSPTSSPEETHRPHAHAHPQQQRRTSASSSATDKRKSTDGLRGLVARLRQ